MKKLIVISLGICFSVLSCINKKDKAVENNTSVSTTTVDTSAQVKSLPEKKVITDVFFKANGTEPFWNLAISDKLIKLKTISDSILTPYTEPVLAQDSNIKYYTLHTELAKLNIQINQKECVNAMSGLVSPYSVSVEYKKGKDVNFTKLEGCGQYTTNYRLHDIWVLEKLNGTEINETDFKKDVPLMEINTTTNSFIGNTGCNSMRGKLFFEREILRFTDIATTTKMCSNNNQEHAFLNALKSSTAYKIENNRLYLFNPSEELLVFKKID